MTKLNPELRTSTYYLRLRDFAWDRAHRATSAVWRTRWFDAFDVADALRHVAI
jgi:hypothetical protein